MTYYNIAYDADGNWGACVDGDHSYDGSSYRLAGRLTFGGPILCEELHELMHPRHQVCIIGADSLLDAQYKAEAFADDYAKSEG